MLDREGLQVAYLGVALAHFLDVETGDIIDQPFEEEPPGDASRYRRIPTRTDASEEEDRRVFVEKMQPSPLRDALARLIDDGSQFRQLLTEDRRVERSFFNFKNDRASAAIEEWLREEGLRD
ncbi:MAG: hypothetical protein M3Q69_06870 [Acidobacteriota bacterium]|nr:hypothetical protein [Acidobacteriota bacterium]